MYFGLHLKTSVDTYFPEKFPKSAQNVGFNMADVHVVGTPIHSYIIMQVQLPAKQKFIMDFGKDENEVTLLANHYVLEIIHFLQKNLLLYSQA